MTQLIDLVPTYGSTAARVALPGSTSEVLFMDNGDVRFAHDCKMLDANRRLRSAPLLQIGHGHTVVEMDPLTIVASIACADCGTHGFVTNGNWVTA